LKGIETENTVVQNIVPGEVTNPVPETITQTVNTTARVIPPLNRGISNQTITASTTAPGRASFPGETAPVPPQINKAVPPAITRTATAPIPAPQVEPITIRVGKVGGLNEQLRNLTADVTVVENVVPGKIEAITPPMINQPERTSILTGLNPNNQINAAPRQASFPGETAPVPPQINKAVPPAITRTATAPIPAPQVEPVTIRVGKVEGLNEQLRNLTADVTVVENVVPGKINSVTPPIVDQPRKVTAVPTIPSFSDVNLNNQTITAAATAPTPPMTTAEQYYYTEKTNREQVDIGIKTEPGITATVARQPRSPNVRVSTSGGNNAG
jgi:hypothetical protein